jgi:hypothetical protein
MLDNHCSWKALCGCETWRHGHRLMVTVQVFTTASMKMTVFWFAAPCGLVHAYSRFKDACCLDHYRPRDGGSKPLLTAPREQGSTLSSGSSLLNRELKYKLFSQIMIPIHLDPTWKANWILLEKLTDTWLVSKCLTYYNSPFLWKVQ